MVIWIDELMESEKQVAGAVPPRSLTSWAAAAVLLILVAETNESKWNKQTNLMKQSTKVVLRARNTHAPRTAHPRTKV